MSMRLKALTPGGAPVAHTRLYLVRHGQVADGHTQLYHGHNDIDLSPAGVRQLEALGAQLQGVDLAAVYASDLSRSIRGAEAVCRGRSLSPQVIPEFREINFGVWEGLSFGEIADRYPEALQARFQDLCCYRIPGGESLMDVRERAMPRLQEILTEHLGSACLLVAHAGVNRVILCEALGLPMDNIFRLDQNYGCLNIIDYFADFTLVRLMNGGPNGIAVG
jgi:alpha-ribazole phosphatase/probable phosphoglycerate mutase